MLVGWKKRKAERTKPFKFHSKISILLIGPVDLTARGENPIFPASPWDSRSVTDRKITESKEKNLMTGPNFIRSSRQRKSQLFPLPARWDFWWSVTDRNLTESKEKKDVAVQNIFKSNTNVISSSKNKKLKENGQSSISQWKRENPPRFFGGRNNLVKQSVKTANYGIHDPNGQFECSRLFLCYF